MVINLKCEETGFSCSYSTWNSIREAIIKYTFIYITKHITDEFSESKELKYCEEAILMMDIIKKVNSSKYNTYYESFIATILPNIFTYMEILNAFEIGGLLSLCLKNDCDGMYTPGNAYDICVLLDTIKNENNRNDEYYEDIFKKTDPETTRVRDEPESTLYEIFEESWNKKIPVLIN